MFLTWWFFKSYIVQRNKITSGATKGVIINPFNCKVWHRNQQLRWRRVVQIPESRVQKLNQEHLRLLKLLGKKSKDSHSSTAGKQIGWHYHIMVHRMAIHVVTTYGIVVLSYRTEVWHQYISQRRWTGRKEARWDRTISGLWRRRKIAGLWKLLSSSWRWCRHLVVVRLRISAESQLVQRKALQIGI